MARSGKRKKPEELRSYQWYGVNDLHGFGHRSRTKQMGYAKEDFAGKPVIAVINTWSPINLLFALVQPGDTIPSALKNPVAARVSLLVGAAFAAAAYSFVVYLLHSHNKRTFMMTVRRLAGQA